MITTTPQRALRGHMPQRPTPRAATTGEHHALLAGRLTPRDRWLARMLHEHRVFTTQQIVELAFPTTRAANHRLLDLYKWRVIDRFQPFVNVGTAPMHYVLDIAGAVALAYEDGLEPKQLGYRHEDAIGIAHSLRLAHTVGTNGFFTALVAHGRPPSSQGQLDAWWSEQHCARLFGDIVRPDGYGRWHDNRRHIEFFLEFDTGTEALTKLSRKLADYEKLATTTGIITPLLVWLPTHRREAAARKALAGTLDLLDRPDLLPIATAAADLTIAGDPAGEGWLPIDKFAQRQPGRFDLADLAELWPHRNDLAPTAPGPRPGGRAAGSLAMPSPVAPEPRPGRFRS